jgi:hypothetical protein
MKKEVMVSNKNFWIELVSSKKILLCINDDQRSIAASIELPQKIWEVLIQTLKITQNTKNLPKEKELKALGKAFAIENPIEYIGHINISNSRNIKNIRQRIANYIEDKVKLSKSEVNRIKKTGFSKGLNINYDNTQISLKYKKFVQLRKLCFDFDKKLKNV